MELTDSVLGFVASIVFVVALAMGMILFLFAPLKEAMENNAGNPIIAKFLTRIFMAAMVVVPTMLVCAMNVVRDYDRAIELSLILQETLLVSTLGFSFMLLIAWRAVSARETVKREDKLATIRSNATTGNPTTGNPTTGNPTMGNPTVSTSATGMPSKATPII